MSYTTYTVDDPIDVIGYILYNNWNTSNFTPKPTIKARSKLLTVDPKTTNNNFVRPWANGTDNEDEQRYIGFDYYDGQYFFAVDIDSASRARVVACTKEAKRSLRQSRKNPDPLALTEGRTKVYRALHITNVRDLCDQENKIWHFVIEGYLEAPARSLD